MVRDVRAITVGERAREIYETRLRKKVEADNLGRYIVIDVKSGDCEIGDDYVSLTDRLSSRQMHPSLHTLRIGYPAVGRLGLASVSWRDRHAPTRPSYGTRNRSHRRCFEGMATRAAARGCEGSDMRDSSVTHSDPEILRGEPVLVVTRVPARNFADWLVGG